MPTTLLKNVFLPELPPTLDDDVDSPKSVSFIRFAAIEFVLFRLFMTIMLLGVISL